LGGRGVEMGAHCSRRRGSPERELAVKRFRKQRRRNALATAGPHRFIIVLDHLKPRYNVGKIFRSADAFGAAEIHLVGIDFFDPAPAMGSFKWVPAMFFDDFQSSHSALAGLGYRVFKMDPNGGTPLNRTVLPERSAFVFGHEEYGLVSKPMIFQTSSPISIPQFGTVQCLNVSVAASLAMYEYIRQRTTA
jgi:tRNA G18 (ribose-2'-O)-methylase SpoU